MVPSFDKEQMNAEEASTRGKIYEDEKYISQGFQEGAMESDSCGRILASGSVEGLLHEL